MRYLQNEDTQIANDPNEYANLVMKDPKYPLLLLQRIISLPLVITFTESCHLILQKDRRRTKWDEVITNPIKSGKLSR